MKILGSIKRLRTSETLKAKCVITLLAEQNEIHRSIKFQNFERDGKTYYIGWDYFGQLHTVTPDYATLADDISPNCKLAFMEYVVK